MNMVPKHVSVTSSSLFSFILRSSPDGAHHSALPRAIAHLNQKKHVMPFFLSLSRKYFKNRQGAGQPLFLTQTYSLKNSFLSKVSNKYIIFEKINRPPQSWGLTQCVRYFRSCLDFNAEFREQSFFFNNFNMCSKL